MEEQGPASWIGSGTHADLISARQTLLRLHGMIRTPLYIWYITLVPPQEALNIELLVLDTRPVELVAPRRARAYWGNVAHPSPRGRQGFGRRSHSRNGVGRRRPGLIAAVSSHKRLFLTSSGARGKRHPRPWCGPPPPMRRPGIVVCPVTRGPPRHSIAPAGGSAGVGPANAPGWGGGLPQPAKVYAQIRLCLCVTLPAGV